MIPTVLFIDTELQPLRLDHGAVLFWLSSYSTISFLPSSLQCTSWLSSTFNMLDKFRFFPMRPPNFSWAGVLVYTISTSYQRLICRIMVFRSVLSNSNQPFFQAMTLLISTE